MLLNLAARSSRFARVRAEVSDDRGLRVKRRSRTGSGGMWGGSGGASGGAGGAGCVHASLQRAPRPQPAPTLSGALATRRPPRPTPPSPTLVAQIDSSVACLWLLTPLSAGTAVVAVLVAVSTNHWLHTEENVINPLFNGTGSDLLAKQTVSGLWRICHTEANARGSTRHTFLRRGWREWSCPTHSLEGGDCDGRSRPIKIDYLIFNSLQYLHSTLKSKAPASCAARAPLQRVRGSGASGSALCGRRPRPTSALSRSATRPDTPPPPPSAVEWTATLVTVPFPDLDQLVVFSTHVDHYAVPGSTVFRCVDIPYFPLSQYTPDPSDSTNAIPYVVTRSAAPLLLAVLSQAVGCLCCVLGHCVKGRRLCTFIAGVLFIVSGLIMLTGIIMYISVFKSQVGHKLRYVALLDAPRMSYSYGYSFGLYVSGFVAVELAGTSAIFLFLQWYQKDWITEMAEKAKADCRAWDREYAFTDFREREPPMLEHRMKRDTYPPTGSSAATPRERRRFVFDGDSELPHCSIHKHRRINLSSASLKDLSSSTLYGFPAAPRPTACDDYFDEFKEVPQSANTLSGLRSASIFQSQTSVASARFLDTKMAGPPPSREEELVTFGAGAGASTSAVRGAEQGRQDRAAGPDPHHRTTPV
ncbi:Voltage-dependent calcium channel gamma-5 subunit [Eumeta japonica]|uniref:Voltage-dependent calcium channel gamma-5 subunit n=1 Tax=Eumeta variegata TaxID=151549 RepID=A0A4C1XCD3_EUMVA|nr:Voltage-dependent calcium channel gamma-5 subunit [Eumeta japonica]